MSIKIAITVNKSDVWFCRICVASIRFYYPEIPIFLIKDELKGPFSTTEIERNWNVQLIEFEQRKFGWSAAKIFFYNDERFKGEKFLVIDADIVFVGRLLENFEEINADLIVSGELTENPYADWVSKTYFDINKVKNLFPEYKFPGYFFNAGQAVIKIGCLPKKDIEFFFNFEKYPFWTQLKDFPLVDQSMLNVLVPIWEKQRKITVSSNNRYMLWSEEKLTHELSLDTIKSTGIPKIIHWAGALRTPDLNKMTRNDILCFFENYYYSKIPYRLLIKLARKIPFIIKNVVFEFYRKVKKIIKNL